VDDVECMERMKSAYILGNLRGKVGAWKGMIEVDL
jgi:hypothetical protein